MIPFLVLIMSMGFMLLEAAQPDAPRASTLITFFIKPYEEESSSKQQTDFEETMAKPARISRFMLKQSLGARSYPGIYATYAGLVTQSDANGQITFPRRQTNDDITLVVTPRLQPLVIHGSTVQQLFIREGFPAAFYHLQRKVDPIAKVPVWTVTDMPIPANKAIPDKALIILADPEHIIVPDEPIVTIPGPTLFLPPLYATKDLDAGLTAVSFLNISRYFALVKTAYQGGTDRYDAIILS